MYEPPDNPDPLYMYGVQARWTINWFSYQLSVISSKTTINQGENYEACCSKYGHYYN
jgi:hypothetical protein